MLTMNELVILRQLERAPDSTPYEVYKALLNTDFPVPMQSVYRAMHRMWEFCAVERRDGGPGKTASIPTTRYWLSDAGRQSLAEARAFFGQQP